MEAVRGLVHSVIFHPSDGLGIIDVAMFSVLNALTGQYDKPYTFLVAGAGFEPATFRL